MPGTADRFAASAANSPGCWRVAAVIALSVMVGSGWLLTEAYPGAMVFPFAGCLHFAVIGLAGLLVSVRNRRNNLTLSKGLALAAAGLGIFVLPGVASQLVAGAVSSSADVALYCAVPLMLVLVVAWSGEGSERRLLMPSLIGLFGALLVFSVEVPGSLNRAVSFLAVLGCCVVMAWMSVWMFDLMRDMRVASAVMVAGFAGAIVLGVCGLGRGLPQMTPGALGIEAARCVLFDLPVVWMTLWLMREVPPARLAARFLIVPVVTWLEGYAMVRGRVEVRSIVGLALMAAGAGMLLLQKESDELPGLQLR